MSWGHTRRVTHRHHRVSVHHKRHTHKAHHPKAHTKRVSHKQHHHRVYGGTTSPPMAYLA